MNIAIAATVPSTRVADLQQLAPGAAVRVLPNAAALDEHLDWIEVVFGNIAPEQVARAPRLRWVQLISSGFEPYLTLRDSPVLLTTARGVTSRAGAEHVLAMMLTFTRQTLFFRARQQEQV